MWTTILTIFYVVWLMAVLVFLWLIWRDSTRRAYRLERALVHATTASAEAAASAAEAARILAEKKREALQ